MLKEAVEKWTVHDSADLYGVARWSDGYSRMAVTGGPTWLLPMQKPCVS